MKKLLFFATSIAALFFAASCQQENLEPEMSATSVTYTVEVPQVETKAIGDGADVNQLIYEVWRTVAKNDKTLTAGNGTERLYVAEAARESDGKFRFTVDLVQDQNYTILFWAQVKDAGYYNTKDLRNVTFSDGKKLVSNNEDRAAFYGIDHIYGDTPKASQAVELTRPFAQINLGSVPRTEEQNNVYELTADHAFVKVTGAATSFNVATATAGEETTTWAFAKAEDPAEGLTVNATLYDWVAMNYIFVPKNQATVTVDYTIYTNHGDVTNTVLNVPVQMNYRTNIVGNLLTSKTEYTVELDAQWGGNDYYGPEFVMEPQKDEEGNYKITNKYELLWLAAAVNGTLPGVETKAASSAQTFKGKTFKLSEDVDLENMEWTPIGNSTNNFQGTFDGNGKTVKNLLITGNNNYVGLFGFTTNGEIKNLTVENAKVSGRLGVGVVAGSPYTSKYTDITVTGHIEVNGMAYVGGVGGRNAYADWTNVKVEADETSYVNANSVEDGIAYRTYVGGVVGFNGEGGHSFKNISSNIDVTGSTIDVGGLFGIAHYQNVFENLSCSGNVAITAAEDAVDAEEIGGIAGVWMDHDAGPVTFTNVDFTGAVTTNIERKTIWYDNLFGKPYNNNGKGKLIVDGCEMVANGVGLLNGEYYISSPAGLVWVEAQEDKFFAGKTIKLAKDIDMAGVTIEKPIHFWNGRTTFDGQNYTISNLTMSTESTEKKPFGLFGGTADIKNVKFNKANISGYSYVAVVAGNLYGNIENCHVSNSSVTCSYWMAGALSGQYNSGNVTNCTVTNTTVTGPAAVGALVGVINETMGERKVENCTVTGCTIAQNGSFGGNYDEMFAAAVGLINIENSKVYFTDCTIDNTTVKGSESTDLFGRNAGDETIVYVNGNEVVTNGVTKDSEGNYYISSADGFKYAATNILSDASKNVTIELANDIDLAGIEWPAVKTAAAFVLDGKGYSIKNLTTSAVEDHGFYSTAMFTSTRKATTIKNLVVEDATITGKGCENSHGAVLVACNYAALNIEKVTVKSSTVSNCDRSSALVTYLYFTTATVKNCVVEGCTVNSIGTAGALLGMNNSHNFEATGNTVKNTTISSSEGSNKAGILIGTWQTAGALNETDNVVDNSKAINAGVETNNNIGREV